MHTGDHIILGPLTDVKVLTIPAVADLSIFARWNSVQGVYQLEVQLQDLEGNVIWRKAEPKLLEWHDPITMCTLCLQHLQIYLPQPGKYDIIMLANGEEVVRDTLWVFLAQVVAS
jgi:hypothetical protein